MPHITLTELSNCYMNLSAYYKQNFNEYLMPYHYHNSYEIMFVESGSCEISVYDRAERHCSDFLLGRNEFVLIDSGVPHKLYIEKGRACVVYNIELAAFPVGSGAKYVFDFQNVVSACAGIRQILSRYSYLKSKDTHFVKSTISRIQNTYELTEKSTGKNNYGLLLQLLIGELFLEIDKCCDLYNMPGNLYIRRIMDYIEANYQNDVSVNDIAEYLNLHPAYVHKLFKSYQNTTLHRFLNLYRVEKSVALLENRQIPLTDVAVEVGFNSRQSFFNAFTKCKGMSPRQYRQSVVRGDKRMFPENYASEYVDIT